MSIFWKYFHDVLRWPIIHPPGPLQALARGLALHMDTTTDDEIYLRRQFFPTLCETAMVAEHGQSRGIIRHATESPEQYRARVARAYAWHKLGGKTEGLPEILTFYGFDTLTIELLRRYQPSRWAEFQIGLKTPTTQGEQEALLADLDELVWLVNEYKPARSVLARLYTDIYNRVPTVWSEDPAWSDGFWSMFSGVAYPPEGDGGLIVSFGMVYRAQSERYNEGVAGLGVESRSGFLAPYIDRPVWSRTAWGDEFPRNHGFTVGELISLHWCEQTTTSSGWHDGWDARTWQVLSEWGRVLPQWRIRWRAWGEVEAVYSSPDGLPGQRERDGTYGDVNACYGLPRATVTDAPPQWGDVWGHDPQRRTLIMTERWRRKIGLLPAAVHPSAPQCAGLTLCGTETHPLRRKAWRENWDTRRWCDYTAQLVIRSEAV